MSELCGHSGERACLKWEDGRHNEIVIKGVLPWRRYAICCSCGNERRIR